MVTLEQAFENLKEQIKNGECRKGRNGVCYADKVLKISGLEKLTVKISMGDDGRTFITMYRGSRVTRQFTIYPDDANDFLVIGAFLRKYGDTLNRYITRGIRNGNNSDEIEVDLEEEENEEKSNEKQKEQSESKKSSTKTNKSKKFNIADEF